MKSFRVVACSIVWSVICLAQTAPGPVVSAGYSVPAPRKAAPGQVLILFVRSTADTQPEGKVSANGFPLPVGLGGYSVRLEQTLNAAAVDVPIFSVQPIENCYGLTPSVCIKLTAVTIQIPWELIPNRARSERPENFAILSVSFQGIPGEAFPLSPEVDSIHVINTCDDPAAPGIHFPIPVTGPCRAVVTHADGEFVTAARPATPGEQVSLYAFGLGRSEGTLRTGDIVLSSTAFNDLDAGFQAGVNLDPIRPSAVLDTLTASAELMQGQVGVYRVTITVPQVPEGTPACTASSIVSNMTVSFGRQQSFGGAGICVDTQ